MLGNYDYMLPGHPQPYLRGNLYSDLSSVYNKIIEITDKGILGRITIEERHATATAAIRDIDVSIVDQSRKRLEEKRASYKHGWSPQFVTTKANMDFMMDSKETER